MAAAKAWTKFEAALSQQGYTFEEIQFTEESGRSPLLAEMGITSELEKGAIITEWKKRLSGTPAVSVSQPSAIGGPGLLSSTGAVSQLKRPAKKEKKSVGFTSGNAAQNELITRPRALSDSAGVKSKGSGEVTAHPKLGDVKLNDLKWANDSCIQLFKASADKTSNSIGKKELRQVAYSLGVWLDEEALYAAMSLLDKNGDGTISLSEFYDWYRSDKRFMKLEEAKQKEVQIAIELFQQYDKGGTGSINRADWLKLWRQLFGNEGKAGRMKPEYLVSAEKNLQEMDKNKDGSISLDEYISWLQIVGIIPPRTK